jgi:phenylacetic acid degradation operon negative regulatory protein
MSPTPKINPRSLILNLLVVNEVDSLTAREAVSACRLFGVRENSVRVALARLSAEGMVESAGRGAYRLGPNAEDLASEVAAWPNAESRLRAWNGGWIAIHVGALSRSDRAALRSRDRALAMLGMRELDRGLFVRPDNLAGGVADVRERLYRLGLERDAAIFTAHEFDDARSARIPKLWDGEALNAHYRKVRTKLEAWMERAPALERDVAARESYLMGGGAIRELVFDPLLPEPFVDVAARHAFVETVRRFDLYGKGIWRQWRLGGSNGDAVAARAH